MESNQELENVKFLLRTHFPGAVPIIEELEEENRQLKKHLNACIFAPNRDIAVGAAWSLLRELESKTTS